MSFFDDISHDREQTDSDSPVSPFDPENIEIGVSAAEDAAGEMTVSIVIFIDGHEAPLPPTEAEVTAWERWSRGDDPDPDEDQADGCGHDPIEVVGYERDGWGVIANPDPEHGEEWLAVPYPYVIIDIEECQ